MKVFKNVQVGKRLRQIRRMLDVSQEDMAEAMNISVGHFQKLERGDHAFSLSYLEVLHEKYGIDLNYLISGQIREQDIARELVCGAPQDVFYCLHQLLASCEEIYNMSHIEEKEEKNQKYY